MKSVLTVLLILITVTTFAQDKESVDLRWKLKENEEVVYMTAMKEVDTSYMEINYGSFFETFSDDKEKDLSESEQMKELMTKALREMDYITTLKKEENGVIGIKTTMYERDVDPVDENDTLKAGKGFLRMMTASNKGIVLRGSVLETGEIHSFWVVSKQKNLLSVLFELPTKPVSVGDKWKLDINFIGNDQNFVCDSAYKINEVTLVDIKIVDGEKIAVLKYNLEEYVNGNFNAPNFFATGGSKELMMKFKHQAMAEFSIDKGRWISYNGIMSIDAEGMMKAMKKTKFMLVPK